MMDDEMTDDASIYWGGVLAVLGVFGYENG